MQLRDSCLRGGANKQSLQEWQRTILPAMSTENGVEAGLQRCSDLRPSEEDDSHDPDEIPRNGREYCESACDDSQSYYWRRVGRGRFPLKSSGLRLGY